MNLSNRKKYGSFGVWLLSDPKAFQVTMFVSAIGGTILFTTFATLSWVFGWNTIISVLFTGFALLMMSKSYKYFKQRKQMGDDQFAGYTLGNFMNVTAVEDDKNATRESNEQDAEAGTEYVGEEHKISTQGIISGEESGEPADSSFFDLIQESNEDEPKL